jgi:hypothetical protein
MLQEVLGKSGGLVRALYFDKPPDRTWSLPWHKDRTIAVEDNSLQSDYFSRPTNKDGVPHVVAFDEVLQRMLTLRIHLDDVDDDNGPLRVKGLRGSRAGAWSYNSCPGRGRVGNAPAD